MILCLVTDRRRLAAAVGARPDEWTEALQTQVSAAVAAGIDLVQVREPDLEGADLMHLLRQLQPAFQGSPARLLVNDRLDVALAARAGGVHLKEQSFSPAEARRLAPKGFVIGRSVHGAAARSVCNDADFVVAGTVLRTSSKSGTTTIGWDGLRSIVELVAPTPVLAIGGIDNASAARVAEVGAAGFAAIGAFIPRPGDGQMPKFFQKRLAEVRLAFDSARLLS